MKINRDENTLTVPGWGGFWGDFKIWLLTLLFRLYRGGVVFLGEF